MAITERSVNCLVAWQQYTTGIKNPLHNNSFPSLLIQNIKC